MQEQFDVKLSELAGSDARILLAVSGGVDSMSMSRLFLDSALGLRFSVAHMNFSLRGEESDGDQALVEKWCREHSVELFTKKVDTRAYASGKGISVEMAARELRYNWFAELCETRGFDCVSVAHNMNDSVETMFLNLVRGTGVKGLCGISPKSGRIIRPMLDFTREQIEEFAASKGVSYRVDSTNSDSCFSRNRIRNEVFPQLGRINPSFLSTMSREASWFSSIEGILSEELESKGGTLFSREGSTTAVNIAALSAEKYREYWLFRLLQPYGFNGVQCSSIVSSLDSSTGKYFESASSIAQFDRGKLKIFPKAGDDEQSFVWKLMERPAGLDPRNAPEGVLYLDADKLTLPLSARAFLPGDRFRPFGMKGSRLVSDYFTDAKLDMRQKRQKRVVCDATGAIVCVNPPRIDDRYRITESTARVVELKFL